MTDQGRGATAQEGEVPPRRSPLALPRGRKLSLQAPSPLVMGILNITPDSFPDGGVHFDHPKAVHAALQMEEDGAAVVDIGGGGAAPGGGGRGAPAEIQRERPGLTTTPPPSHTPHPIHTRESTHGHGQLRERAA